MASSGLIRRGFIDCETLKRNIALAHVSVFSMLIGLVFWCRGVAPGGIAAVGQLQLLQPYFGLLIA